MKAEKCCKVGAYGTVVSAICCLGVVGVVLALFGATAAIAFVNNIGDFIFLPAYGAFATLLVFGMLSLRKNWLTYITTAAVAGFAIYLSLSVSGALLTLGGIVLGIVLIFLLRRK